MNIATQGAFAHLLPARELTLAQAIEQLATANEAVSFGYAQRLSEREIDRREDAMFDARQAFHAACERAGIGHLAERLELGL